MKDAALRKSYPTFHLNVTLPINGSVLCRLGHKLNSGSTKELKYTERTKNALQTVRLNFRSCFATTCFILILIFSI